MIAPQARAFSQVIESELAAQRDVLATKLDLSDVYRELELKLESVKSELVRRVFLCILGPTAVLPPSRMFQSKSGPSASDGPTLYCNVTA